MNIHLHIERLVLEGFEWGPRNVAALDESLRTEFARMLADRELGMVADATVSSLSLPALSCRPDDADGRALGSDVAKSLHTGLTAWAAGTGGPAATKRR